MWVSSEEMINFSPVIHLSCRDIRVSGGIKFGEYRERIYVLPRRLKTSDIDLTGKVYVCLRKV